MTPFRRTLFNASEYVVVVVVAAVAMVGLMLRAVLGMRGDD